ncbi:MAG: lysine--tRNA ligase [Planctomycetia bacterium]|nr:lysine--tRNA ligase [Planctomycetia bacterium]
MSIKKHYTNYNNWRKTKNPDAPQVKLPVFESWMKETLGDDAIASNDALDDSAYERFVAWKTTQDATQAAQDAAAGAAALEAARREKLEKIVAMGIDPWGHRRDDLMPITEVRNLADQVPSPEKREAENATGPRVVVAGRIMLLRPSGKVIWTNIKDRTGSIQVMIGKQQVGERNFTLAQCFDLGDLIVAEGELSYTRTGELTIFADKLDFMAKSINTPPDKHSGLADREMRQRMRYIDLIHTPGTLERFQNRSRIIQSVRRTLDDLGFIETEGPTLHAIAGGAAARPFITHHNALDMQLYLRIALELHLKRLLVGGMERVYEIGRVYRNEGVDTRHNPEFTMIEIYQAFGDYHTMMDVSEQIILNAIRATGREINEGEKVVLPWGENDSIDFTPPFARRKYYDLVQEYAGIDPRDNDAVKAKAVALGLDVAGKHPDVILNDVFEETVESNLQNPTFVYDYPESICPLTKRSTSDPSIAERFELFVKGMELGNAYTELNDPDLQERLFTKQLEGQAEEDSMAKMDHDFIRALRYGMPPAGGLGIGIDRLVMLLTNSQNIRDVILFPLLRMENN